MEETISLRELFETIRKRIVMIVLVTVFAVTCSGIISYFVLTPVYKSSTQILVSQQATGTLLQAAGFDVDSKYISTYNVILKSPYILDQVIEELDLNKTPNGLNSQTNVSQEGNSQVVTISVEDPNPSLAVDITNTIAHVFQREIANLLRVDNIVILSPAELPETPTPVSPNPTLNMAIAFVVGLMAAVGIAFLLEYLDNTIRSEQDIEKELGLPVLGTITVINDGQNSNRSRKKTNLATESVGSETVGS